MNHPLPLTLTQSTALRHKWADPLTVMPPQAFTAADTGPHRPLSATALTAVYSELVPSLQSYVLAEDRIGAALSIYLSPSYLAPSHVATSRNTSGLSPNYDPRRFKTSLFTVQ